MAIVRALFGVLCVLVRCALRTVIDVLCVFRLLLGLLAISLVLCCVWLYCCGAVVKLHWMLM